MIEGKRRGKIEKRSFYQRPLYDDQEKLLAMNATFVRAQIGKVPLQKYFFSSPNRNYPFLIHVRRVSCCCTKNDMGFR